ncbi:MAG: hypothetical protein GX616_18915 [Planctomycetes bacterium]|nr:hypothetical protein [Planctomycetota bacterium]
MSRNAEGYLQITWSDADGGERFGQVLKGLRGSDGQSRPIGIKSRGLL